MFKKYISVFVVLALLCAAICGCVELDESTESTLSYGYTTSSKTDKTSSSDKTDSSDDGLETQSKEQLSGGGTASQQPSEPQKTDNEGVNSSGQSSGSSIGSKTELTTSHSDTESKYSRPQSIEQSTGSIKVYITPHGERYHFDPDCGGKNAYAVDFETAARGRTPCKKCANG